MMQINTKSVIITALWIGFIAGLGVLCVSAVQQKKGIALQSIAVEISTSANGSTFLTAEDIEQEVLALTGPVSGHRIGNVECGAIEEVLRTNPFISDVDVYVTGTGVLHVKIRQREPVIRVLGEGKNYYLDIGGAPIPVSRHYTARVPVLSGNQASVRATEVLDLMRAIRADGFFDALIEQLHFNTDGDLVLIPKIGNVQIVFGRPERVHEKLEYLKAFYTDVLARGAWDRYSEINVSYRNQIVCKKNPTT